MTSTLRWGICATGWISTKFALDLLVSPATRNVTDVSHIIAGVASRSTANATKFVESVWKEAGATEGKEKVKTYGKYEELFADPNVDVVYVGTPHSHHYQNVHAALSAGKGVLCEKSLTVNAAQAQALVDLARAKNVFFMEAVWTRFQPVSYKVQEIVRSGVIGELRGVQAELSMDLHKAEPEGRMLNPDLAGGALLDLGPYPWTWLALLCLPPTSASRTPLKKLKLAGSMTKTATGVDASSIAVIQFPQPGGRVIHGTLNAGLNWQTTPQRVALVQGSKGYLEIGWPTYRPSFISYSAWASEDDYAAEGKPASQSETFKFDERPGKIWGFAWEADEVARCVRDGKIESERMPLRDTILMMETFDEIRNQGELVYPEAIETLDLE